MAKRVSKPVVYSVPRLSEAEIAGGLTARAEWSQVGDTIQRTVAFKNFVESMEFVNKVAALAEADRHHPDIMVRYNKVTLTLSTHDAGGLSAKDFSLAAKVDALCG